MTEKGHDGMAMPFGMPMPQEMEATIMEGVGMEQLSKMLAIMQNLPLYAGCMADMIHFLTETGQVENFRDFLVGRLCDKHREMAPDNIFENVPEVLGLFEERLEDYLESLDLERCRDHDEH